jgi:hypothetical protein
MAGLMAVQRYVLTSGVTVPPGTRSAGSFGSAFTADGSPLWATAYYRNQVLLLDTAGALYTALSGSLRAYVPGTDDIGRAGISN